MERSKELYVTMYKTVALVVALLTLVPLTSGQVDSIRLPETSGCVIVGLVLERIEKFILPEVYFSSDSAADARDVLSMKEFLRRIAAVESDYGRADHTYRENYHGGIWQVDEADFDETRGNVVGFGVDLAIRRLISIDWSGLDQSSMGTVEPEWQDLRRPLYSGLAAMLKLLLARKEIPEDVAGQADFWISYYRNNSGGRVMTRENFIAVANSGCSVPCQSYPDIVFVIDSSGSITLIHFQQALNFTANLVPEFRIGQDYTRIGVIIYNSGVVTSEQIELNRYFDASELSAAIRGIRYSGGGTETGRAIRYATDTIFDISNGARNDRSRVGIVLTDGRSGDDVTGPSDAARSANINLIAIGIGTRIVEDELLAIAGSHEQVYLVETFADLPSFSASIETASCLTAVPLELGDAMSAVLMDGEVRYLSLTVRPGETYTLQIDVTHGDLVVYGSLVTDRPGPDAYDFKLNITGDFGVITDYLIIVPRLPEEGTQRKRRQIEPNEEMTLVLAFVGVGDNASLELNVTEGDSRRYGDLAVSLTEDENADGTTFYVCEANCTCEQAYVTLTVSTTVVELPEGAILNQISNRKAEVILPNNYLGLLHCVIATPGVLGSEVFDTINITDINECLRADTHNCSAESSLCKDIIGGFQCVCKDGFRAEDIYTCTDIDECSLSLHNCNPKTRVCMNTAGSYECPCKRGYRMEAGSQRCQGPYLEDLTFLMEQEYADVARSSLGKWIDVWSNAERALPDSPFNLQQLPVEPFDAGYSYFVDSGRFAFKFDISEGADATKMKLMVTKYSFE